MARQHSPKTLLVEGDTDKRIIPELIEANGITWGEAPETWVANIKPCNGFENLVKPGLIETELKATGLQALGIIADANQHAAARWASLRTRLLGQFPDLPDKLPAEGLIEKNEGGQKVGVWLMPDNRSRGMMETFLTYLVPDDGNPLLEYAQHARDEAQVRGAPFKDTHADKATIHTWLAWQDPPGRQLHNAVTERILDPHHAYGEAFVTWFRSLFGL